ncbi:hypothetical protein [Salinicoccus roseus]|uniref:hypothetical protein n=1 Tax=Salinicoccus roseus TaxID=45670 RepID=UPI0022FFC665|nr:hypothetical protein [Salinicoccus roseus]
MKMTHITNCPGCNRGLGVRSHKKSLIYFKGYCKTCRQSFKVCNMEVKVSKLREVE